LAKAETDEVKVLIVDDHPIVLSGCRALLAETDDMLMLEARNAATAVDVYTLNNPDVAVIDVNLPDVSGFELARRLQAHDPDARIIMFSMNDDPMFATQAIEGGARGYFRRLCENAPILTNRCTIPTSLSGRTEWGGSSRARIGRRQRFFLRRLTTT